MEAAVSDAGRNRTCLDIKPNLVMLKLLFREADKLQQLDQLIRLKCTGNPENLASKLGVSKRHVNNYIQTLKELGAEVSYCRTSESYVYLARYKLNVEISIEEISEKMCRNYSGGAGLYYEENFFEPYFRRIG